MNNRIKSVLVGNSLKDALDRLSKRQENIDTPFGSIPILISEFLGPDDWVAFDNNNQVIGKYIAKVNHDGQG